MPSSHAITTKVAGYDVASLVTVPRRPQFSVLFPVTRSPLLRKDIYKNGEKSAIKNFASRFTYRTYLFSKSLDKKFGINRKLKIKAIH
jgi:hypothetical protein